MRFLGIDFGSKNIGLALSDEAGQFAFSYEVIKNDKNASKKILDICKKEDVGSIIIGESKSYSGADNPIMKKIKDFAENLSKDFTGQILFEPEFYTTKEAERIIGGDKDTDARAAAIILKSYLDRKNG